MVSTGSQVSSCLLCRGNSSHWFTRCAPALRVGPRYPISTAPKNELAPNARSLATPMIIIYTRALLQASLRGIRLFGSPPVTGVKTNQVAQELSTPVTQRGTGLNISLTAVELNRRSCQTQNTNAKSLYQFEYSPRELFNPSGARLRLVVSLDLLPGRSGMRESRSLAANTKPPLVPRRAPANARLPRRAGTSISGPSHRFYLHRRSTSYRNKCHLRKKPLTKFSERVASHLGLEICLAVQRQEAQFL